MPRYTRDVPTSKAIAPAAIHAQGRWGAKINTRANQKQTDPMACPLGKLNVAGVASPKKTGGRGRRKTNFSNSEISSLPSAETARGQAARRQRIATNAPRTRRKAREPTVDAQPISNVRAGAAEA
jgi:hypothetical protein